MSNYGQNVSYVNLGGTSGVQSNYYSSNTSGVGSTTSYLNGYQHTGYLPVNRDWSKVGFGFVVPNGPCHMSGTTTFYHIG
tara:strand:- start:1638 stop:1877 length:240 start_codon:yes stop_codon:yes gene_type:complete